MEDGRTMIKEESLVKAKSRKTKDGKGKMEDGRWKNNDKRRKFVDQQKDERLKDLKNLNIVT